MRIWVTRNFVNNAGPNLLILMYRDIIGINKTRMSSDSFGAIETPYKLYRESFRQATLEIKS